MWCLCSGLLQGAGQLQTSPPSLFRPCCPHRLDLLLLCPAGWVGGIFILLLFYVITLWSSLMLAECHETNGVKHPTYRAAVLHVLGEQPQ